MTLIQKLQELFPQFKVVKFKDFTSLERCDCFNELDYLVVISWKVSNSKVQLSQSKNHLIIELRLKVMIGGQGTDKFKLKLKNTLREISLKSENYDLMTEFDFQSVIQFVKAHQGEWTHVKNNHLRSLILTIFELNFILNMIFSSFSAIK
jgi:hypothetical protein